jgi:hypothetical protein
MGVKHVFAVLLRDALIVIEYPSDRYFIEFADQRDVLFNGTEIDAGFYLFISAGRLGVQVNLPEEFHVDSNFEMDVLNGQVPDEHGRMVRLFLFDRIVITRRIDEARWSRDVAREKARNDVATFVVAHLLQVKEQRRETILDALQAAIDGFEKLLAADPQEEAIQRYLTERPVLLEPTAAKVTPKIKLGTEYVTDFVIELASQQYVLVEIEVASKKLFTKAGFASAHLAQSQGQVEDWRQWVHDHVAYARTTLPGIDDPNCWVILGRRRDLNERGVRALARKNKELPYITIQTYDDLVDKARRHLTNLQRI